MNKENIILDFEDILNSYKSRNTNPPIKHLFPIYLEGSLTEEYAYLIGKVMGHGNLDPLFTLRFIGKEDDLILMHNLIIEKFKISANRFSIRRRESKGVSHILQINCAYLGRILFLLGAPIRNKTKTSFRIPNWILTSKLLTRRFLQALLEDELTTIKIKRCNYSNRPRLKLTKEENLISNHMEFMQQVKQTIESFEVECSNISRPIVTNTLNKYDLYFHLRRNKKNIIRFKEQIGFRLNQNKIKKLDACYEVLKSSIK